MKYKKGLSLGQAPGAVLLLVLIGMLAVVGVKINAALQVGEILEGNATVINHTTAAYLSAGNSTAGIGQITGNLSLIGLIVAMAIVIGILFSSFGGMFNNGGI